MIKFKLIFVFILLFALNFSYSQNCITDGFDNSTSTSQIGTFENIKLKCNFPKQIMELKFDILELYTNPNGSNDFFNLPIYIVKNNVIIWTGSISLRRGTSLNNKIEIPNTLTWTDTDSIRVVITSGRGCAFGFVQDKSPNCPIIHQGRDIKCLMKDIKADFYLEQTKTNGETIIINTVPKTTSGVEHYWGIIGNGKTPNCNCSCEDIPLDDIKNAKTTGVWATHIKSDGTFENIGIGTNVTSGTSWYGIKYGGFPYYSCYKITHYIVCGNRIESFTTCVNQSTNN